MEIMQLPGLLQLQWHRVDDCQRCDEAVLMQLVLILQQRYLCCCKSIS